MIRLWNIFSLGSMRFLLNILDRLKNCRRKQSCLIHMRSFQMTAHLMKKQMGLSADPVRKQMIFKRHWQMQLLESLFLRSVRNYPSGQVSAIVRFTIPGRRISKVSYRLGDFESAHSCPDSQLGGFRTGTKLAFGLLCDMDSPL